DNVRLREGHHRYVAHRFHLKPTLRRCPSHQRSPFPGGPAASARGDCKSHFYYVVRPRVVCSGVGILPEPVSPMLMKTWCWHPRIFMAIHFEVLESSLCSSATSATIVTSHFLMFCLNFAATISPSRRDPVRPAPSTRICCRGRTRCFFTG